MEQIEELLDKGKFSEALKLIEDLEVLEGDKACYLFFRAEARRGLGFFDDALKDYGEAQKICEDDELLLDILLSTARCSRALGREEQTDSASLAACTLSEELEMKQNDAMLERALSLRLCGQLGEAEKMLKSLAKSYSKEKDLSGLSFVYWSLGGLYRLQGKYKDGIKAFEKSLESATKNKDKEAAGYALFGLGGICRVAGFMGRALESYVKARKIFAKTDDNFAKAYVECGTSNVLRQMGRLEAAWQGYERAHELYSSIEDWADLGFVEWGLGEISRRNGDFKAADKYYKNAAKLFAGRSEPRGEALVMLSQAQLLYLTGKTEQAEEAHSAAMEHIRKHGLHTHLETFT
ncbi:MAG: hypothetical protein J5706_03545 [Elusimicrobiales bacterium]|nr:hypothetical protein [Elusimicrobiales bacterium]